MDVGTFILEYKARLAIYNSQKKGAAGRGHMGLEIAVAYVADGEERKKAAGLGIRKFRVLRRRGRVRSIAV